MRLETLTQVLLCATSISALPSIDTENIGTKLLIPGTNYCGRGDRARSFDDLGSSLSEDLCCRDHDYCDDYILPGETKYGLHNDWLLFVVSNCDCDRRFLQCLNAADTILSKTIKFGYFNLINVKCFTYDYPRICTKRSWWKNSCKESIIDYKSPKKWQWRDLKDDPDY
ncbi:unnamed protein product [Meganyctiphanes norvegica]|uniref:Phospholipase A2-like central domain-containing protein n=1 Tax=Meganyctiphanes norvegica TaxID=48144 RepID=A0AAV2QRP9_MEGNR